MKIFKSLWLKLRKSNGLPGNEVLIPMTPATPIAVEEKTAKKPRKKKETKDVTN
jgi:hypothetical protein